MDYEFICDQVLIHRNVALVLLTIELLLSSTLCSSSLPLFVSNLMFLIILCSSIHEIDKRELVDMKLHWLENRLKACLSIFLPTILSLFRIYLSYDVSLSSEHQHSNTLLILHCLAFFVLFSDNCMLLRYVPFVDTHILHHERAAPAG